VGPSPERSIAALCSPCMAARVTARYFLPLRDTSKLRVGGSNSPPGVPFGLGIGVPEACRLGGRKEKREFTSDMPTLAGSLGLPCHAHAIQ